MDKEDHLASSLQKLETAVGAIQDSDTFRAYLSFQAKFHQYSFNNVLLIQAQRPDATMVAGFNRWKELGRNVVKGEKAIRIIAPNGRKVVENADEPDKDRVIQFFKAVPVFAYEQTDGNPLPVVDVPVLQGGEGAELYSRIESAVTADGVSVHKGHERFTRSETIMGFYLPQERQIHVREGAQLQEVKTLAHEAAHHYGSHLKSDTETETVAESVAYVVLARYGLDSGERSFPYVAVWAKDKNTMRGALGTIQKLSAVLIDKVSNPQSDSHGDGEPGGS